MKKETGLSARVPKFFYSRANTPQDREQTPSKNEKIARSLAHERTSMTAQVLATPTIFALKRVSRNANRRHSYAWHDDAEPLLVKSARSAHRAHAKQRRRGAGPREREVAVSSSSTHPSPTTTHFIACISCVACPHSTG